MSSDLSELPLHDYSLREMFRLLGIDNVLKIFGSVLLENQILLVSTGKLTALTFLRLLRLAVAR